MGSDTIPAAVNGYPVVALAIPPDLPEHRVVVCRTDDGSYVVWTVAWDAAWKGGQWTVSGSGRYDLPWNRALDVMATQARESEA